MDHIHILRRLHGDLEISITPPICLRDIDDLGKNVRTRTGHAATPGKRACVVPEPWSARAGPGVSGERHLHFTCHYLALQSSSPMIVLASAPTHQRRI